MKFLPFYFFSVKILDTQEHPLHPPRPGGFFSYLIVHILFEPQLLIVSCVLLLLPHATVFRLLKMPSMQKVTSLESPPLLSSNSSRAMSFTIACHFSAVQPISFPSPCKGDQSPIAITFSPLDTSRSAFLLETSVYTTAVVVY